MATSELKVAGRETIGKKVRVLRRQGIVPANIYGRGIQATSIQADERELERVIVHARGTKLVSLVGLDGPPRSVLVKLVKRIPTTGKLEHVDFYQVSDLQTLQTDIPIQFVGASVAVTKLDGTLLHSLTHVHVECYPRDLPSAIEVDVSVLTEFGQAIHVRDLVAPAGVEILTDGDELVAKVAPPHKQVETREVDEEAAPVAVVEGARPS